MIYSINMHTKVIIIYAIILYEDQIARISFIMALLLPLQSSLKSADFSHNNLILPNTLLTPTTHSSHSQNALVAFKMIESARKKSENNDIL